MDSKAAAFREQVAHEWATDETASAWQKHYKTMRDQLQLVTDELIGAAQVAPGHHVLDLASGTGVPSLAIADKIGPSGKITATDLNPAMLSALRTNAAAEGLSNIETHTTDAHELPFPAHSFDRVTSRFGVMFFCDVPGTMKEVRRVLKPGGKVAFMAWGAPIPGSYFALTGLPFIKRLPEAPDPDGPGPMRFAEPGKLAKHFTDAGYSNVTEKSALLPIPFKGEPSELMMQLKEIAAPFREIMARMPAEVRDAAWNEAIEGMASVSKDGVIQLTAPVLTVTGDVPT